MKTAIMLSWILYITSLFLPSIYFEYIVETKVLLGRHIFFMGWLAIIYFNFGWYANPFYWLSIFVFFQAESKLVLYFAIVLAAIAFVIALYSLSTKEVWFDDYLHKVVGFGTGYYFWLASITVFLLTMIFELKTQFYKKESNK